MFTKSHNFDRMKKNSLRLLATLAQRCFLKQFCRWKTNCIAKCYAMQTHQNTIKHNRNKPIISLMKIHSRPLSQISTIVESPQENVTSPRISMFDELKRSLNLKLGKIDKNSSSALRKKNDRILKSKSMKVYNKPQNVAIIHSYDLDAIKARFSIN